MQNGILNASFTWICRSAQPEPAKNQFQLYKYKSFGAPGKDPGQTARPSNKEDHTMNAQKRILAWIAMLSLAFASHGVCDYISNIRMTPSSPACLLFNQKVTLTFDFSVSEAAGTLIFVRPFSGGALTPHYAAHASQSYPAGKGTGTAFFTIMTGDITVDQLRFQLKNADQSKVLLEFFIPVEYHFSAHAIENVHITPDTPSSLLFGQDVNITFDYTTSQPGGVRIFARPMTNGATTPGYGAHGSPLYPVGSGTGSGYFTINSGNALVDHLRLQMYNNDQSQLLIEYFIPVEFHYAAHAIKNIVVSPAAPHCMLFNEHVNLTFDYSTPEPGGVRIFARPFSGSGLPPHYAAHGSPLYPAGSGSGTGYFTITSGNAIVDKIRFQMFNSDQSQLLLELFIPAYYPYFPHKISEVQFEPAPPAYLTSGQKVAIKFNYLANQPGGVRIFARPFSQGGLTPNYAAHGSPLYADGSGSGDGFYEISNLSILVDETRFQMLNADQSQLLLEFFLVSPFYFGNQAITGLHNSHPIEPQTFTLDQNYPNPFNPTTSIHFTIPAQARVSLCIFNSAGEEVAILCSEVLPAGSHTRKWDGTLFPSGVYFYRLQVDGSNVETKKFTLIR
ncbi:MAG TPA: T9SS type A sorting domain-containing protein [bacterium]|nr:T9SS type A sorting domain-containing protein [bacterium]HQI48254.1 T9SS type A sorting domain-containing protein [bacterium]HQJ65986.1 T9SS type A sorting domain-containing protein [bacterium]